MTEISDFHGEHRFLSNFWIAPVKLFDVTFKTSEHAFQALKTKNRAERQMVIDATTPGRAKRAGRQITVREDWDDIKIDVMLMVVRAKFTQNRDLALRLHSTGDAMLIEGNTWGDRVWGCVLDGEGNWVGENHLGLILMQVRSELKAIR